MPAYPTPPPDNSGGYMVLTYTNGIDTHRAKIHVAPFSATPVGGSNDRHYSPALGGVEVGILDTLADYLQFMKLLYDNTWLLGISELYQVVGGVPSEVFPPPVATPVAGTSGTATVGVSRAVEAILNVKTSFGRPARFSYIGVGGAVVSVPQIITPNAAGTTFQKILAYLQGADTGIVGHDGHKVGLGSAKLTTPYNRRLRRHYGFS